jgi:hypothetical protein
MQPMYAQATRMYMIEIARVNGALHGIASSSALAGNAARGVASAVTMTAAGRIANITRSAASAVGGAALLAGEFALTTVLPQMLIMAAIPPLVDMVSNGIQDILHPDRWHGEALAPPAMMANPEFNPGGDQLPVVGLINVPTTKGQADDAYYNDRTFAGERVTRDFVGKRGRSGKAFDTVPEGTLWWKLESLEQLDAKASEKMVEVAQKSELGKKEEERNMQALRKELQDFPQYRMYNSENSNYSLLNEVQPYKRARFF